MCTVCQKLDAPHRLVAQAPCHSWSLLFSQLLALSSQLVTFVSARTDSIYLSLPSATSTKRRALLFASWLDSKCLKSQSSTVWVDFPHQNSCFLVVPLGCRCTAAGQPLSLCHRPNRLPTVQRSPLPVAPGWRRWLATCSDMPELADVWANESAPETQSFGGALFGRVTAERRVIVKKRLSNVKTVDSAIVPLNSLWCSIFSYQYSFPYKNRSLLVISYLYVVFQIKLNCDVK